MDQDANARPRDSPGAALLSEAERLLAQYLALNHFGCTADDSLEQGASDPQTPYVLCPGLLAEAREKAEQAVSGLSADGPGAEPDQAARKRAELIVRRIARVSATVLPYNTLLRSSHKVFGIKPAPTPVPPEELEAESPDDRAGPGFERAISSYDDDTILSFIARHGGADTGGDELSGQRWKYLFLVARILCTPVESKVDFHVIRKDMEAVILRYQEAFWGAKPEGGAGAEPAAAPAAEPAAADPAPPRPAPRRLSLEDADTMFYLASVLLNARVHDGPEYLDEPYECLLFVQRNLADLGRRAVPGSVSRETAMDALYPAIEALFSTHIVETPWFMLQRALAHYCSSNQDYQGAFERYTEIGFLYEALEILLLSGQPEKAQQALLTVLSKLFGAPRECASKDLVEVICGKLLEMENSARPSGTKKTARKIGETYLEHQRFFTAILYAELGLAELLAIADNKDAPQPQGSPETRQGTEAILLRLEGLNGRDARVQRDLGEFYLHLAATDPNQLHPAFAHYRKAAQLDPGHLVTKDKLGSIYLRLFQITNDQKYLSMAYEMYRRVADSTGENYQAAANLGNVCTIQGDLRQSSSYFYTACRMAVSMDIKDTTVFTRYLYQCFAFIMECEKARKELKEEEEAGDAREAARVAGKSGTVVSTPANPKGVPLAHKNRSTVEQFVFVSSSLAKIVSPERLGPDKMRGFLNTHLTLITSISYHLITSGSVKSAASLLPALQPWQGLMNDYAPLLDDKAAVPFADMLAGALGARKE